MLKRDDKRDCLPVPELTRNPGIKLNERISLPRSASAVRRLHRIIASPSGPSTAKPSGDHTPPGGFVRSTQ
jgi:hypothetical protein